MNTYYTLTALGFLLSCIVDISQRNKASKRTPKKFSLWFFFEDNWDRLLISGATSIILIQMYHIMELDLAEYEDFFAVAVGFCPDLVIGWLKRKFDFLK